MTPPLSSLCRALGYEFHNPALLQQALTHRSVGGKNNERFEFLGDAILGFVIADALFEQFERASEGQLSRLRSSLVKRETLAKIARGLKLGDHLRLGPGELRSGGQTRDSILADAVEAILAAIYLDSDYSTTRRVILQIFESLLTGLDLNTQQKDPKTRLQEHLQARKIGLPSYQVIDITGDQHAQTFTVKCRSEALEQESDGSGSSRRRAEQAAAAAMLQRLEDE
ncbi:ribonuclease III [Candidatus Endoriftia persephonae]|uniref:Ribonuclease 3 n=2 Tax=Gammaproteobacteria TaxID=1236 RepID=G2FE90_9GAMM|nr:ribonuclease III [Candidatus Endoriftia persephone]EGW54860.1 ribonuclease 3 [endosymbiont of Tevnia jerichonana (vent Tica)]USF89166.1 ribonuclease III [Candidatus Endoriftia persephone]